MELSCGSREFRKVSHWSVLCVRSRVLIREILALSWRLMVGSRFLCHRRRKRFLSVISSFM